MQIAQIVITKTQKGFWKVTVMSLEQTEKALTYQRSTEALARVVMLMEDKEWEELSL